MFISYELFCTALPVYRYQIMLLEIKLLNPEHCGKTSLHKQFKEKFARHNLRIFTADVSTNSYLHTILGKKLLLLVDFQPIYCEESWGRAREKS